MSNDLDAAPMRARSLWRAWQRHREQRRRFYQWQEATRRAQGHCFLCGAELVVAGASACVDCGIPQSV